MLGRRRQDPADVHSAPATESIDEALARLARQDTRLNPVAPAGSRLRALGRPSVARDRLWTLARWVVILAVAWLIWRFGFAGER